MKKIIVFSTNDDGTVEYLDEKQKKKSSPYRKTTPNGSWT